METQSRTRRRHGMIPGMTVLALTLTTVAVLIGGTAPPRAGMIEPGGDAAATSAAMFSPNDYAWELFFYINHQAASGPPGVADPDAATIADYDEDQPVVWESWALATGGVDGPSDMLLPGGGRPLAWNCLPRPARGHKVLNTGGLKADVLNPSNGDHLPPRFMLEPEVRPDDFREESRVNRALYEAVIENELYHVDGIENAIRDARRNGKSMLVDFPRASKAVKAHWEKIDVCQADRFHHRWIVNSQGVNELWGLVALHITTKDVRNWFWCTFEHESVRRRAAADNTVPNHPPRPGTEGSKWQYYRLRGTQTEFIDAGGVRSRLSNPSIELDQNSSCIACHSCAGAGLRTELYPNSMLRHSPRADWDKPASLSFSDRMTCLSPPSISRDLSIDGRQVFFQSDFVWTFVVRAYAKQQQEKPAAAPDPKPVLCHDQ